ncbi:hypothetical protein P4637_11955 [Halalkalibacterium halodurans]|nr:hypothetical protein [Halalkalibacterium halodurans]MED4082010.1 hypothetical protein [Halalkalibacterium halodurans]MED4085527.1 hypothetical protein [Halalkalibacterium halodurans]MED4103425.1 hypothetical protein [Halalkalibacterium halodurans]MED4110147.1 hypothetical protein [Halalkalibacterium halodurans]MED4124169.1 hypothetical protein [Halalkalibacterium halodurans]
MTNRNEMIQRKIAMINARKIMGEFEYLQLINFEEQESHWIHLFQPKLEEFLKINSKPTYEKVEGDIEKNYILWIEDRLNFLKNVKEWLIGVPNCSVWANVKVLDYAKAIEELWLFSEDNSFLIADKSSGVVVQTFSEEKCYEIHIGKCDVKSIESN